MTASACDQRESMNNEALVNVHEWQPHVIIRPECRNYKVITSEELMQFIKDNDTGVTEEDFEGIDIDDFIASFMFGSPAAMDDTRLRTLDSHLKRYDDFRVHGSDFNQMQPLVLISFDSIDYEYERFIETYFDALGMKHEKLNQTKEGFDRHMIKADGNNLYLYTGATKNIEEYDIRNERQGQLILYILEPEPLNTKALPFFFVYSKDKNFFGDSRK